MMAVTALGCLIGNLKWMVKIAAACDAQHKHLGEKMPLVLMGMQPAVGEAVP